MENVRHALIVYERYTYVKQKIANLYTKIGTFVYVQIYKCCIYHTLIVFALFKNFLTIFKHFINDIKSLYITKKEHAYACSF